MTTQERRLDVVIADDAPLFRSMVAAVLAPYARVREVGDAPAALQEVGRRPPDIAILDIRLPPTRTVEGIEAASELRERRPAIPVLLLSQRMELQFLDRLLDRGTGGVGYLLKERVGGIGEFVTAVRTVAGGGHVVDPVIVAALVAQRHASAALTTMPPRARQVLALLAEGHSNAAISARLHISAKTVETNVSRIFGDLGLTADDAHNRRVLAVLRYLRRRPDTGHGETQPG